MNKTITALLLSLGVAASAQAEWNFGIGTGLGLFDIDGELESDVVDLDLEYDIGDIESGFGLNGYAANGPWVIRASASYLEVEADQDSDFVKVPDLNFERTNLELTVGYTFVEDGDWKLGAFVGVRNTDIELDQDAAVSIDDDWTDVVIGGTASYAFAEEWTWDSMVQASFGDSEGTYGLTTGVTWMFAKNWSTSATITWETWEYDSDDAGVDYTYDADEVTLALGIMYHF